MLAGEECPSRPQHNTSSFPRDARLYTSASRERLASTVEILRPYAACVILSLKCRQRTVDAPCYVSTASKQFR